MHHSPLQAARPAGLCSGPALGLSASPDLSSHLTLTCPQPGPWHTSLWGGWGQRAKSEQPPGRDGANLHRSHCSVGRGGGDPGQQVEGTTWVAGGGGTLHSGGMALGRGLNSTPLSLLPDLGAGGGQLGLQGTLPPGSVTCLATDPGPGGWGLTRLGEGRGRPHLTGA